SPSRNFKFGPNALTVVRVTGGSNFPLTIDKPDEVSLPPLCSLPVTGCPSPVVLPGVLLGVFDEEQAVAIKMMDNSNSILTCQDLRFVLIHVPPIWISYYGVARFYSRSFRLQCTDQKGNIDSRMISILAKWQKT